MINEFVVPRTEKHSAVAIEEMMFPASYHTHNVLREAERGGVEKLFDFILVALVLLNY
jgi:hypothetical protein